ncbi:MAG: hypothetical protein ACE5IH_07195 [Thermodesulfobacteriota bacterium]
MIKGLKTANLILVLVAIAMGAWLVDTWSAPVEIPTLNNTEGKAASEVITEDAIPISSYYNVIIEKDLFRPSRKKYIAKIVLPPPPPPPPPPPSPPPPPPPPKRPVPKFTLYGTVILEDKDDVAIISTNMQNRKPSFFKVGDEVEEGFVLKEIHKNKVILAREEDEERTEVSFKPPSMAAPTRPERRQPRRRPRPPTGRRRGDRSGIGQEPLNIPIPEFNPPLFGRTTSPSNQEPSTAPSKPHDETQSSSKVPRGGASTTLPSPSGSPPTTSTTTSPTSTQPSDNTNNDSSDSDSDASPSLPSEGTGETSQGEGDIPSPPTDDADELPPPIPSS